MFTPEQEAWLAAFADKGIKDAADEVKRQAESEAASQKYLAREAFLTNLIATKEAEKAAAIAEWEEANK